MKRRILNTFLTLAAILLFYFIAGAAVVINRLEGAQAKFIQGIFIWISVLALLLVWKMTKRPFSELGLKKWNTGSIKAIYYGIPPLIAALLGIIGGINTGEESSFLLSSLFLTLGVGFSEELYFRGVICSLWKGKNLKGAIFISAALFGICHIENIFGGAELGQTLLQICFAFIYGVVFGLIYVLTESVFPCVFLHFFHDFCSFIGNDLSNNAELWIGAVQTVLLLGYVFLLFRKLPPKQDFIDNS